MQLPSGSRLGPYEILSKLGEGGMGAVYRARDPRLGREVAVKVVHGGAGVDPRRLRRFQQEALAVGALNHPNLLTVFDLGDHEGLPYLVFELLEGTTLRARLAEGWLPLAKAVDYAIQIARGLAAAHDKGIVHRDLKPENVFVKHDQLVKVLDFGLAKLRPLLDPDIRQASTETASWITEAGTVLGTVGYMSPEQVRGDPTDHRADIFAFGAVLHEMLTGQRAFQRETAAETMTAILKEDPPSPSEAAPGLPATLDRIVRRCLEKRPPDRFQSAQDMAFALEGLGGVDQPPTESRHERTSIAVLPFADLSPEADQAYFCEGMAEEILSALVPIEGLRVASRVSTFGVGVPAAESPSLARHLGVDNLLEGSVRKAGGQLRIAARLVRAADGSVLWAQRYDRELKDVFLIQDEIAESIARILRVATERPPRRSPATPPTGHIEAYEFYLRGRRHFYRATREDLVAARRMFARAIEIDLGYTRAYAGLADSCCFLYQTFARDPALLEEADRAIGRALALEADSAEAHTSRGVLFSLWGRLQEAEQEFETAIRLAPDLFEPHYLYGMSCYNAGRLERAAREFERASQVHPDDYQSPLILGSVFRGLGQGEKAEETFRRGLTLAERQIQRWPEDVRARYLGAAALVALGQAESGVAWARAAIAQAPRDIMTLYNVAGIFATAGRTDEALDHLEALVRAGFVHRVALENDPDLAPLRAHHRYRSIVDGLAQPSRHPPDPRSVP